jgi:hypothetical protein
LNQILAIIGGLGVIISVTFAGWQSREVAKQTRIQNALAGSTSLRETVNALHNALGKIVEWPELRPYFYEGKPCPREGETRARVLMVAEMITDVAEHGLQTHGQVSATGPIEDWNDYVDFLLEKSPSIVSIIEEHSPWYPLLVQRLQRPRV